MINEYFDSHMQRIADTLLDSLPNEWSGVELTAELEPENAAIRAYYWLEDESEKEPVDLDMDALFSLVKDLRSLREITAQEGMPTWDIAVYSLNRDGEFSIDFRCKAEISKDSQ